MRSTGPTSNSVAMYSAMAKTETERIPIVGHIITDEDVGALQGAKLQHINLNKVVKLLTDPHSVSLFNNIKLYLLFIYFINRRCFMTDTSMP